MAQKSVPPDHIDLRIAELAERQLGLVTRPQLSAAGVGDNAIGHRVAIKRLRRIHPGVYATGGSPLTLHSRWLAAVLAYGPRAALSHRASAALLDLCPVFGGAIDVTVPRRGGVTQRAGTRVHRTRTLHSDQLTLQEGIPCTTVARTLVDCAGLVIESRLNRMLEQAQLIQRLNTNALIAELERARGKRGTATLRRLLSNLADEPPRLNRELERRFREFLRQRRFPQPIINGIVDGYEVDFHWPAARLIVETDGRETHATPAAFERDRRRDLDLEAAGWTVIRITWRMLHDEPDRIKALLRSRLPGP